MFLHAQSITFCHYYVTDPSKSTATFMYTQAKYIYCRTSEHLQSHISKMEDIILRVAFLHSAVVLYTKLTL
jgi:hypothetical protein